MLGERYLDIAVDLLQELRETQLDKIMRAAELIAQATFEGHTFYAWGGPHSSLSVQDIYWRAGGLATVNAVFTPGLSYEVGPLHLHRFLQRAEGAGTEFFAEIGAEAGDVILLVSTSGRNPFPIEMAMSAKEAGLTVIGMTSMAYTTSVPSLHSSGRRMHEFCDVVLDNLAVPGDAILEDEALPQKVGPTSGWMGCLILQTLVAEVAERLAAKGIEPPLYYPGNLDGQDKYRRRFETMRQRHGTKFGGIYSPRREM